MDARGVYAHPCPEFRRLVDGGVLHRLATGYYAVVPMAAHDRAWMPSLEAAAFGIGGADYGAAAVARRCSCVGRWIGSRSRLSARTWDGWR